jgi:hypothetical protein
VLKIPLSKIVRDKETQNTLFQAADRLNRITLHLTQFLRLWALHKYEHTNQVPQITETTISMAYRAILNTQSVPGRRPTGQNRALLDDFENFFTQHYQSLGGSKFDGRNLTNIINGYMSTLILTNLENNIKCHFQKYLNRYVNGHFLDGKDLTSAERKQLRKELAVVKKDLMTGQLTSNIIYHPWILEQRTLILPILVEETHYLGHKKNPQSYLGGMFFMNKKLEMIGRKTFQPFPLRRELIPKYIPIDSHALVSLFDFANKNNFYSDLFSKREEIWDVLFKMDHPVFHNKKIVFDFRLLTDGLATSLQFIQKEDEEKKNLKKAKMREGRDTARKIKNGELEAIVKQKNPPKEKKDTDKKVEKKDDWPYLEDLNVAEIEELKKNGYIVADPGKNNLLYLMDETGETLRFTKKERNKVTKLNDFRRKIEKFRKNKGIEKTEEVLSLVSGKTCDVEKFKNYIRVKNDVNKKLGIIYNKEIFRKFRWYSYVNRGKYFDSIVRRIKKKFGKEKTLIYGDYEGKVNLKGSISTPGIGLKRKIASKIKVVNIDEFRTSALNYKTEDYCENLVVEKDGKKRAVHAILTYKTDPNRYGCIGRDLNAVRNMKKLVDSFLGGKGRPRNFQRGQEVIPIDTGLHVEGAAYWCQT